MTADPPRSDPKAEPTANGVSMLVVTEPEEATTARGDRVRRCLRANLLVLLTVVAVIAGVALGLVVLKARGGEALDPATRVAFGFPGELLLRLLKMIILPLVVCSLVGGAASLDPGALGRLGAWALLFFLLTTLLASALGVGLALALQPGASYRGPNVSTEARGPELPDKEVADSFLDLVRNIFPSNLVSATFQSVSPGGSSRVQGGQEGFCCLELMSLFQKGQSLEKPHKTVGFRAPPLPLVFP